LALLGDIALSFLKRCANVKDCGSILGVHGGMLDRIDSLLLIYPFMYWYALEYMAWTHSPDYAFEKVHVMNFFRFKN
jgi:CDP-diglyceride synthetase